MSAAPSATHPQSQRLTPALPLRDGSISISTLVDTYMGAYAGRDTTRAPRLAWWVARVGNYRLDQLTDDHLHAALEELSGRAGRYYAGVDADGKAIYKAKKRPVSGATLNRYAAGLSAVLTWAIRRRIAPVGWDHPGRRLERHTEGPERTRYLTDDERDRLLEACRASKWKRLYLFVLLALTTGARKGELQQLCWGDVDLVHSVIHVARTKNGDPKALPLTGPVLEELRKHQGAPGALVFASARRPQQPYNMEPRWRQALAVAKIRGFRVHDLRHTCASWLAQNGATLLQIGDLLGHRTIAMSKRYSHLAASHRAELVNRILGTVQ